MPSSPLLSSVPSHVQHRANIVSAYNMLLRLEKIILADIDSAATKREKEEAERSLMYCRIVGHFFYHVPTDMGLTNIVLDVTSTAGNKQQLLDLGKLYYNHALLVFRSAKGQTLAQSCQPSPPSFDTVAGQARRSTPKPPDSKKQGESRSNYALVRDGFKCIISGTYDINSLFQSKQLMKKAGGNATVTKCTHICKFSESTNVGISEGPTGRADSAWAVLSRIGGRQNLLNELSGERVHRLENVITLECCAHLLFDSLDLWLEPSTGVENECRNQYHVKGEFPEFLHKYPKVVEFSTNDPINLPLPSRDYLALHAACAKVAHLSAATEYMDSMFKDMEEMLVLSTDGTSAAVLEHAIWVAQRKLSLLPRYQEERESVKYDEGKLVVV